MTRSETYQARAAKYAQMALDAPHSQQSMYAELAKAWRELAEHADADEKARPRPLAT